jgi:hypothetical protein
VNEGLEVAVDGLILSLLRPNVLAKPLVRVRDEVGGDGMDELLEEEGAKEVHCIHAWGITLKCLTRQIPFWTNVKSFSLEHIVVFTHT